MTKIYLEVDGGDRMIKIKRLLYLSAEGQHYFYLTDIVTVTELPASRILPEEKKGE